MSSLLDMVRHSAVAAILTHAREPDNPIVACNEAFLRLTGYDEAEVVGRNCRFLAGAGTEPDATALLRDAVRSACPAMVELLNYRKDGTPFRNAVMIAPVFDDQGDVEYFLGSQVEVSASLPSDGAKDRVAGLSRRQRQVLIAMARGQSSKRIAHEFRVTERTVKMHRAALFRRLGVRTAVEAIRIAIEAGH